MPEYLAPGVFIEEVSYRAKSIEGVSTTTTGFVGATRYGPVDIEPDIITSLVEYERVYGGKQQLDFGDGPVDNYTWNAVRAFFEEGGKRLYIARAFTPRDAADANSGHAVAADPDRTTGVITLRARFPGAAGDSRASLSLQAGANRFTLEANAAGDQIARVRGARNNDIVHVSGLADAADDGFYTLTHDEANNSWTFNNGRAGGANQSFTMASLNGRAEVVVRTITASVEVISLSPDIPTYVATELPLDPGHTTGGAPDSLFAYFDPDPDIPARFRSVPIIIETADGVTGMQLLRDLVGTAAADDRPIFEEDLLAANPPPASVRVGFVLTGGNDGDFPALADWEGAVTDPNSTAMSGLKAFETIDDISIVAAPGSSAAVVDTDAQAVANALISHCRKMRYRIAIIDPPRNQSIADVRSYRGRFDSTHAAFYYPWVRISDPNTGLPNHYPPSGFVAGIYARNDTERAVYKAPANEVVNLALGFERLLNKSHQEVLNPEGVNCFRYFEGRGMRLWGARTMSSDPEWKYVNLRRYFAFLEHSIDKGTQWAVFEPNGERLWANVKRTIDDFLLNEWQNGALLGDRPEKSYFVKCDRSTMTQNDLDNGRLVCQVGVAALRPAEFVIFRIGQWTADRKA